MKISPRAEEAASIPAALHTIRAHHELEAPKPPNDALAPVIGKSEGNETDVPRWVALAQSLEMRRHMLRPRMCRNQLHELTPDNTYQGKKGQQCRACRNQAQAYRRRVA